MLIWNYTDNSTNHRHQIQLGPTEINTHVYFWLKIECIYEQDL